MLQWLTSGFKKLLIGQLLNCLAVDFKTIQE